MGGVSVWAVTRSAERQSIGTETPRAEATRALNGLGTETLH